VADEDPRKNPAPLAEVPALVAEGAARYNAGKHWHAHESWEQAWHALRAAGKQEEADFLQGLVFVTAAFENRQRGKLPGFRRQLAKGIARLQALEGRGAALGLLDEGAFVRALARVAADEALPAPPLAVR
jgi:predicted metal-dependent hydrolase